MDRRAVNKVELEREDTGETAAPVETEGTAEMAVLEDPMHLCANVSPHAP
jgi:hypothetical protein